jgi:CRISPR-associated protein Cas1
MVVREDEQTTIHLSEIDMVIVETTAAYVSSYLLAELSKAKIPVVFCDLQHNPTGQFLPLYGSHDTSRRVKEQVAWSQSLKESLWQNIVKSKILNQARNLEYVGLKQSQMLFDYAQDVQPGDSTNREGHAAKVYFNALFGKDFTREKECGINARLDYGYAILLAWFNREIVSRGYITQLGINHRNDYNHFNLACDFMEPFRPLIDRYVLNDVDGELTKETRIELVNLFEQNYGFNGGNYHLTSIISLCTKCNLGILAGRIEPADYLEFGLYES